MLGSVSYNLTRLVKSSGQLSSFFRGRCEAYCHIERSHFNETDKKCLQDFVVFLKRTLQKYNEVFLLNSTAELNSALNYFNEKRYINSCYYY